MNTTEFAVLVETFQHPTIILREALQEDYTAGKITFSEYMNKDAALAEESYRDTENKFFAVLQYAEEKEAARVEAKKAGAKDVQRRLNSPTRSIKKHEDRSALTAANKNRK